MNDVLRPFLRQFVLIFFDHILIYNVSWTEHLGHIRVVLSVLRQHQLFLKRSKCSFGERRIHYLGHIIENGVVSMDIDKIKAVQDWPLPPFPQGTPGLLGPHGVLSALHPQLRHHRRPTDGSPQAGRIPVG